MSFSLLAPVNVTWHEVPASAKEAERWTRAPALYSSSKQTCFSASDSLVISLQRKHFAFLLPSECMLMHYNYKEVIARSRLHAAYFLGQWFIQQHWVSASPMFHRPTSDNSSREMRFCSCITPCSITWSSILCNVYKHKWSKQTYIFIYLRCIVKAGTSTWLDESVPRQKYFMKNL